MKLRLLTLLSISLLLSGQPSLAQNSCESLFNAPPTDYVKYVPGDFITFMRSNPTWSWAWFSANKSRYGKEVSQASQFEGVVGADVKPDNIDIARKDGKKRNLGLIDLDDGGRGSLLGDVFHTLAYNKIWHTSIPAREALALYKEGLRDKEAKKLDELKPFKYQERLDKLNNKMSLMKAHEDLFFSELKLMRLNDLSGTNRTILEQSSAQIEAHISSFGKVIYRGARLKESGGSVGVPRFTYLVQSGDQLRIIEYKFQPDPAVAVAGTPQLSHIERLSELLQVYRPNGDWGNILALFSTNAGIFIVREKMPPMFDGGMIPNKSSERAEYENYVRHMFYWLGKTHGEQSKDYRQAWAKESDKLEDQLMNMVETHVDESMNLYQKNSY